MEKVERVMEKVERVMEKVLNFVRGPGSNLYEILRLTWKCFHLNGHEVTGPLPMDSCRNSVHRLGVDVRHFMDGTPFYVTGVGDHLL